MYVLIKLILTYYYFQYSLPKEERRNMSLLYNKMTIEELSQIAPNVSFLLFIFVSLKILLHKEVVELHMHFLECYIH